MLDDKVKKTLKYMIIGSAIYNIAILLISIIVFIIYCSYKKMLTSDIFIFIAKNELCVLIGFVAGIVVMYNMAVTLMKAMDSRDPNFARRHVAMYSIIRLLIFCVLLYIIIQEKHFGLSGGIMFTLSALGVKIGAYLYPFVEKKMDR